MQMQLASSHAFPEPLLAAMPQLREKPHLGLSSKNPALHQVHEVCNSTTALGFRAALHLERIRSRYTGKEHDTESGNDYFEARYYSSAMGRFMSPDWSAKEESDDPVPYADLDDPQSLNLYAYVRNNPLKRVDADGHIDGETADDAFKVEGMAEIACPECTPVIAAAAIVTLGVVAYENRDTIAGWFGYKPGGDFSPKTKKDTATAAGGTCALCGTKTTPAEKSQKGVTPPATEGQTDHKKAKSKGGTNDPSNAQHTCRKCNREKSDKDVPPAPAPPPPPPPPPPPTPPPPAGA
jgi:RHS repeat-associated protein